MSGSVNKVTLVGRLGKNPEIRTMQNGGKVANLSLATSESWRDKATGERKEKTEWHRVVIFGKVAEVAEKYLKKGSKVYISGSLQTRKYQKNGQDTYTTEVVVQGFGGELVMLDEIHNLQNTLKRQEGGFNPPQEQAGEIVSNPHFDDEIPF